MNERAKLRILIADDHYVVRQGLRAILEAAGHDVVAEACNGQEAVEGFTRHRPDVAILDVRMPVLDGVAAIAAITAQHPQARLIALSGHEGDVDIRRALDAGASTYVLKRSLDQGLPELVAAVARGERRLPADVRERLDDRLPRSDLSDRETQVMHLVAQGLSNKDIAARLGLSVNTINTHVATILLKLGADDRAQAVTIAVTRGIVRVD